MDTSSQFDVLCIGDCVIDAFLQIHEASVHCRLNKKDCELCIQYGGKIPVDDCQFLLGGDGANVSVGLSKLGFKSGLFAEIGDDEFSAKIIHTLSDEGVNTSLLKQIHAPSTFSMIISFQKERTIFSRHVKRDHDFDFSSLLTQWVYLTSLGEEWKKAYQNTIDFVKNSNAKLAFNPGSHQLEVEPFELSQFLQTTDVFFVNKEEAETITGMRGKNIPELLMHVQNLGPKIVVITDGLQGSYSINTQKELFFCPALESPVVERTGAGDAFASGFLGAIMSGLSYPEAMQWGTANASSVVQKVGAEVGLLNQSEIKAILLEHPEFKTEKLF